MPLPLKDPLPKKEKSGFVYFETQEKNVSITSSHLFVSPKIRPWIRRKVCKGMQMYMTNKAFMSLLGTVKLLS